MITHWWLGLHENASSSVRICARCDSNDAVTLSLTGEVITPDIAVDDGNIVFNATGLSANSKYPFTLTQTNTISGIAKTSPVSGDTWSFVVGSCLGYKLPFQFEQYIKDIDPAFLSIIGDQIYCDQPSGGINTSDPGVEAWNGEIVRSITWLDKALGKSFSSITDAEWKEAYYSKYRMYWKTKGFETSIQNTPLIQSTDDHTWPGNDPGRNAGKQYEAGQVFGGLNYYRGHIPTGGTNAAGVFCANQADVDKQWQFGIDTYRAYAKGNPESPDVNSRTPLTYPLTKAERLYYDFVIADVHFIVLENCAFRDTPTQTIVDPYTTDRNGKLDSDASKRILGDIQFTWLESTVKNSTSTFKVFLISKETIGTQDAWQMYDIDQARLLAYLKDGGNANSAGWSVKGGCTTISGDAHRGAVLYDATNEHLQLRASPSGNNVNTAINSLSNMRFFDSEGKWHYLVEGKVVGKEYIELRMIADGGWLHWHGRIYPGSNVLRTDYSPDVGINPVGDGE